MANIITVLRILGTLLLCFTSPLSSVFFVIYTLTGVTDVLDGYVARKTNTVSEFGAKLDSVADLTFYGVIIYKLFPNLYAMLPTGIWYAVLGIIILRVFTYIFIAIKYRDFMSNHTYLNKLTGFCVFLVPYFMKSSISIVPFCIFTFIICVAGSVYDLVISFKRK